MILKVLEIIRVAKTTEGTFGVWKYLGVPFALSGELPWNDNKPNISCIPKGTYTCELKYSEKHKAKVYWVQNVPGRNSIQIHKGTIPLKDSLGCILIGEQFEPFQNTKCSLMYSGKGYTEFTTILSGELNFTLNIMEV